MDDLLQRNLDKLPGLCRRLMQIVVQGRIFVVTIGTLGAVDLECGQIADELCEILWAFTIDGARDIGETRQLLPGEPPWSDASGELPTGISASRCLLHGVALWRRGPGQQITDCRLYLGNAYRGSQDQDARLILIARSMSGLRPKL